MHALRVDKKVLFLEDPDVDASRRSCLLDYIGHEDARSCTSWNKNMISIDSVSLSIEEVY